MESFSFWKMVEGANIVSDFAISAAPEALLWALLLHNWVSVKLLYWSKSSSGHSFDRRDNILYYANWYSQEKKSLRLTGWQTDAEQKTLP